jgi:uncharacterized protein YndB with AHSA1/START domain
MRTRVPASGTVEVVVAAGPEQVWDVITDVTRIAEWSHECRGAEWLDGATGPSVGARFTGHNRVGPMRWSRTCTITDLEPGRVFAYSTGGGLPPDSTAWMFRLVPEGSGTRIVQSFQIIRFARVMEAATALFVPPHRDRSDALRRDLERLGEVALSAR